jgi:hypothetical protein
MGVLGMEHTACHCPFVLQAAAAVLLALYLQIQL